MSIFGVFLFCIFPHSERIWRDTPYFSVFSPNAGRSRIEKLRIQTLLTQWKSVKCFISILPENIRKLIFFLTSLEGTEMGHYAKMGKRKKVMLRIALGEKYPYLEFFGSVFSDWLLCTSPCSVRIQENTEQKNSEYGLFSRSVVLSRNWFAGQQSFS